MGLITYSFLKLQQCNLWSLGMGKQSYPALCNECNYLSMLEFKLNHVITKSPVSRNHTHSSLDRFPLNHPVSQIRRPMVRKGRAASLFCEPDLPAIDQTPYSRPNVYARNWISDKCTCSWPLTMITQSTCNNVPEQNQTRTNSANQHWCDFV